MKQPRRLFAFGCSYTSYAWPTWANFLGIEFAEVQNWGMSGLGNRAIAERVAEANMKYKFCENDVVIVQWSSHIRNDWWHQEEILGRPRGWKTMGSIFGYLNEKLYDKKWIDTFFFEPAFIMHTLNNISLTQGLLKSTGCEWYMTSIGDIRMLGSDLRKDPTYGEQTEFVEKMGETTEKLAWKMVPELQVYEKPIWEDHADHWLMGLEELCNGYPQLTYMFYDIPSRLQFYDFHPSPRQHVLWIEKELKERLNVSDETMLIAHKVVDFVDAIHVKLNVDKRACEYAIARSDIKDFECPTRPRGF